MKIETLILRKTPLSPDWFLQDSRQAHIGTFASRQDAETFAQDNGYRLQIQVGDKIEWFNPKLPTEQL